MKNLNFWKIPGVLVQTYEIPRRNYCSCPISGSWLCHLLLLLLVVVVVVVVVVVIVVVVDADNTKQQFASPGADDAVDHATRHGTQAVRQRNRRTADLWIWWHADLSGT